MSNNTSFRTRPPFGNAGLHKSTSSIPTPNVHEVLVRIHAVSLNFRDTAVHNGLNLGTQMKEEPVLCSDMAGEVVEVGEGVREWRKGDRVTANFDQSNLYGIEGRWDRKSSHNQLIFFCCFVITSNPDERVRLVTYLSHRTPRRTHRRRPATISCLSQHGSPARP